ncbi:ankyrin repeat domain-containing protein [Robiginitalea sp. SC105]|uniref:ankyrin repeat domain-containing protein n=1 Tax=Robiginitalea sp. SC105 TaxID=2762332 RepID=UPI00163951D9|nr:ankyrin repeat domain-containing protein [Robiginitalea sp. SC105]MBC2839043.1 ankyrin repeat domain-containing protein [Robiginitalea sp. SC105]
MKTTSLMAAAIALFSAAQLSAMSDTQMGPDRSPVVHVPEITLTLESPLVLSGLSPFCKAIMQGDMATVEKMIQLGEDVNRKSLGKTPVIFAARYNQPEILEMLLDNGADPTIRCDNGYTALKHAELSNATETLHILRKVLKT